MKVDNVTCTDILNNLEHKLTIVLHVLIEAYSNITTPAEEALFMRWDSIKLDKRNFNSLTEGREVGERKGEEEW